VSTKISELPESTALTGAEQIPLVQDGETRRVPAREIVPIALGIVGDGGLLIAGRGATISKPSTGQYEIAIDGTYGVPVCVVTPAAGRVTYKAEVTGPGQPVVVRFYEETGGVTEGDPVDTSFSFVVFDAGPALSTPS